MLQIDSLLCLISEASSSAILQQAVHLACSLGATLHVLPTGTAEQTSIEDTLQHVAGFKWTGSLDAVVDAPLKSRKPTVEELQQYVQKAQVDLIMMETPADRGPIPPLAVPRIQALIEGLDCSLFAVAPTSDLQSVEHILVPTDLSPRSQPALEYATALAARSGASIDLLHVIEGVPYVALTAVDRLSLSTTSFPEQRARRRLTSFLDTLPVADVSIDAHFQYGDPTDQILRFANRHQVDLMVLSSHGRHTSTRSTLGRVADRVLRRSTCPVLLVRSSRPLSSSDGKA